MADKRRYLVKLTLDVKLMGEGEDLVDFNKTEVEWHGLDDAGLLMIEHGQIEFLMSTNKAGIEMAKKAGFSDKLKAFLSE